MPKLDGFAFLRLLMAKQPRPVVIVSSHATRESVFRALELGAVEFVAKPSRILSDSDLRPVREDLLRKLRTVTTLSIRSVAERMRLHGQGVRLRTRSSEDLLSGMRSLPESTLLPRFLVEEELADGKLVIPWKHAMPSTDAYYLAYPEHSAEVPKVRDFVKWMLEQVDSPEPPPL